MRKGLAECEWISGVLESAVYQDFEPSLHRRRNAVGCCHTMKVDEASVFLSRVTPRCSSAFFLGHVVSLSPPNPSDKHLCFHSCSGTGMRV